MTNNSKLFTTQNASHRFKNAGLGEVTANTCFSIVYVCVLLLFFLSVLLLLLFFLVLNNFARLLNTLFLPYVACGLKMIKKVPFYDNAAGWQSWNIFCYLQTFGNIPVTGQMDAATKRLMQKSRCGLPDVTPPGHYRSKRYTLHGQKWHHVNLTWRWVTCICIPL